MEIITECGCPKKGEDPKQSKGIPPNILAVVSIFFPGYGSDEGKEEKCI